jgi:hypothetical protein
MDVLMLDRGCGAETAPVGGGEVERDDQEEHRRETKREEEPIPDRGEIVMARLCHGGAMWA